MKMKFECVHIELYSNEETSKIILESNAVCLDEILDDFKNFLNGCGFVVQGNIEVVDENN